MIIHISWEESCGSPPFNEGTMSLRLLIFLFVMPFMSASLLQAQKHDYTWILGYTPSTGYDPDSTIGFTIIPFEEGVGYMYYKLGTGQPRNTNAHISDPETGELLFYFDGCRIFNRNFEIMENGDSLFHGIWWKEWCDSGSKSYVYFKNGLIIPVPDVDSRYYLIHTRDTVFQQSPDSPIIFYNRQMNYSIVDFENVPEGEVGIKAHPIYIDSSYAGVLHAVRHANNLDWWVFTMAFHRDEFIKVLVKNDTLHKHGVQKFDSYTVNSIEGGQIRFSPDGSKMVLCTRFDGVHLFDFDRLSGDLSNKRIWEIPDTSFTFQVTSEFSPNGRFLYVSNMFALWQIDTWEEDLNAGTTLISVWDGLVIGGFHPTSYCDLTLAPDCKIYMGTCGTTKFLHVIHEPDLPGAACGFEQRGVTLKSVNGSFMPLFVNYRLGSGPVCDPSLATSTESVFLAPTVILEVSPVPGREMVWVRHPEGSAGGMLTVYDSSGRQVYQSEIGASPHEVVVSGWSPGLYFLSLFDREGRYAGGRMVVE